MARLARVAAVGVAYHITQRGNARRDVFESQGDRLVYLSLLRQYARLHQLSLLGYCLMSNHVHLVAIPHRPDSMARALLHAHGRYAACLNTRQGASGHVWQGRYYSCPLDQRHLWAALRYAECNPVRAAMLSAPEDFPWSSAAAHCSGEDPQHILDLEPWRDYWTPPDWRFFLHATGAGERDAEAGEIRAHTHTGRPLGSSGFVRDLERELGRSLAPHKGGRPPKSMLDPRQCSIFPLAATSAQG
jgi:putative transposase